MIVFNFIFPVPARPFHKILLRTSYFVLFSAAPALASQSKRYTPGHSSPQIPKSNKSTLPQFHHSPLPTHCFFLAVYLLNLNRGGACKPPCQRLTMEHYCNPRQINPFNFYNSTIPQSHTSTDSSTPPGLKMRLLRPDTLVGYRNDGLIQINQ